MTLSSWVVRSFPYAIPFHSNRLFIPFRATRNAGERQKTVVLEVAGE